MNSGINYQRRQVWTFKGARKVDVDCKFNRLFNELNFIKDKMEIIPYNFLDHSVRMIIDDKGEPWFVAMDVCKILGLKNVTMALLGLDPDEKRVGKVDVGSKSNRLVSEPGLYTLIMRSHKPEAKKFQHWLCWDVLPSIRKTGSYSMNSTKSLPEALRNTATTIEKKEASQGYEEELQRALVELKERKTNHEF